MKNKVDVSFSSHSKQQGNHVLYSDKLQHNNELDKGIHLAVTSQHAAAADKRKKLVSFLPIITCVIFVQHVHVYDICIYVIRIC